VSTARFNVGDIILCSPYGLGVVEESNTVYTLVQTSFGRLTLKSDDPARLVSPANRTVRKEEVADGH
jgi:hypothetical protein